MSGTRLFFYSSLLHLLLKGSLSNHSDTPLTALQALTSLDGLKPDDKSFNWADMAQLSQRFHYPLSYQGDNCIIFASVFYHCPTPLSAVKKWYFQTVNYKAKSEKMCL